MSKIKVTKPHNAETANVPVVEIWSTWKAKMDKHSKTDSPVSRSIG